MLKRFLSLKPTKSSTSALSEDESGSDRYSISDDEYIYADDEDNPDLNKPLDKDKHLSAKKNNNDVKNVSKKEEEALKSSKLTPDQIREVKEAFHVFDTNGDGCITATELKKLVTSLGYNITEAELMDMMNQIGENRITQGWWGGKNLPGRKVERGGWEEIFGFTIQKANHLVTNSKFSFSLLFRCRRKWRYRLPRIPRAYVEKPR